MYLVCFFLFFCFFLSFKGGGGGGGGLFHWENQSATLRRLSLMETVNPIVMSSLLKIFQIIADQSG